MVRQLDDFVIDGEQDEVPAYRQNGPPPIEYVIPPAGAVIMALSQYGCPSPPLGSEKGAQVAGQPVLVHAVAIRANMRSILVAMMKSFSCSPLIFLVCRETVALPQPKLICG